MRRRDSLQGWSLQLAPEKVQSLGAANERLVRVANDALVPFDARDLVVVDLEDVSAVDSSFLPLLVGAQGLANELGSALRLKLGPAGSPVRIAFERYELFEKTGRHRDRFKADVFAGRAVRRFRGGGPETCGRTS